jgi:hypothetical protein
MKNILILLFTALLPLISNGAGTSQLDISLDEVNNHLSNQCKYELSDELQKLIIKKNFKQNEKITAVDFYFLIKAKAKKIQGKMSFSCFNESSNSQKNTDVKTNDTASVSTLALTAKEIIRNEDSGGRYMRLIAWEKKINTKNWAGTVAHVNTIFGDKTKIKVPDFFLICPASLQMSCIGVELPDKLILTNLEKNFLVDFLIKNIIVIN